MIEIIVTVAIFTILVGLGLFMGVQTIRTTTHRSEEATIVSLLQKARSRAVNNMYQSKWGVCYSAPNYVIFKGVPATCAVAAPVDVVAANTAVAAASGFVDPLKFPVIVFDQLTGDVTTPVPPVHILVVQDTTKKITINHEGTIIW